jgi:uncharacterized Zn finger protein (UPF0148 family)
MPEHDCDNCGVIAPLFHNEPTGLAFCETCDQAHGEEAHMPITTTLDPDKETPGTIRFTEPDAVEGERPLSIYLPKEIIEALGLTTEDGATASIKLTIERA